MIIKVNLKLTVLHLTDLVLFDIVLFLLNESCETANEVKSVEYRF